MNIALYPPENLSLMLSLPASKSISNRALIISALSGMDATKCNSFLQNISDCDDTTVMLKALQHPSPVVDIMAAGTAMRFLSAYYSVTPGCRTITGTERMRHRPIAVLVEALRLLGAEVEYAGKEGFPPLRISGTCKKGRKLELPGNISSQYISALLMIGPTLEGGLILRLTGEIVSRPYIDMTLHIMQKFGASVQWTDACTIEVGQGGYSPKSYYIENDWSATSYWYEMVALTPDEHAEVILPGLFKKSLQGDCAVENLFGQLGVKTEHFCNEEGLPCIRLTKSDNIANRIEYNLVNQPDLAQTLVTTCVLMQIPFRFTGLQSLKIKETDRIAALRTELRKLGFDIQEEQDCTLFWNGETCPKELSPSIDTYDDHRMALALAPACFKFHGLCIREAQVVSKSYPQYWQHLKDAAFIINKL